MANFRFFAIEDFYLNKFLAIKQMSQRFIPFDFLNSKDTFGVRSNRGYLAVLISS